jgi:hypothetical protein
LLVHVPRGAPAGQLRFHALPKDHADKTVKNAARKALHVLKAKGVATDPKILLRTLTR